MSTIKLRYPAGMIEYIDSLGHSFKADASGLATVDSFTTNVGEWLRAGFVMADASGTTAARPANPYVGQSYFDTTLNLPIWRGSSAWINSTGTVV